MPKRICKICFALTVIALVFLAITSPVYLAVGVVAWLLSGSLAVGVVSAIVTVGVMAHSTTKNLIARKKCAKAMRCPDEERVDELGVFSVFRLADMTPLGVRFACVRLDLMRIFVDDSFYTLSDEAQDFVLCHELAHIELMHRPGRFNQVTRFWYIATGRVQPMELEADELAAKNTSATNVAAALGELLTPKDFLGNLEIRRRIKALS